MLALAFVTLSCSPGADSPDDSPPGAQTESSAEVWNHARLRGVTFRAVGQEPGWSLDIYADTLLDFAGDYGAVRITAPTAAPEDLDEASVYTAIAAEMELRVIVQQVDCSDTMSGEAFPTRVVVTAGGREYTGCGRPVR